VNKEEALLRIMQRTLLKKRLDVRLAADVRFRVVVLQNSFSDRRAKFSGATDAFPALGCVGPHHLRKAMEAYRS
jgi:hypothetical protein